MPFFTVIISPARGALYWCDHTNACGVICAVVNIHESSVVIRTCSVLASVMVGELMLGWLLMGYFRGWVSVSLVGSWAVAHVGVGW